MRGLQNDSILLMHSEDGGLGIAAVYEDSSLALWSWKEDGDDKKGTWACRGVMDLSNLVQEHEGGFRGYVELLGFAEGINVIFIGGSYVTTAKVTARFMQRRDRSSGSKVLSKEKAAKNVDIKDCYFRPVQVFHFDLPSVSAKGAKPVVEGREDGQSSSFGASSTNGGVRSLPLDPIETQLSNEESGARVRESVPIEATRKSSRVKKLNTKYLSGDWVNH
ncbi:hypothetical protein EJB05_07917, partial [Eragrostis curvula]